MILLSGLILPAGLDMHKSWNVPNYSIRVYLIFKFLAISMLNSLRKCESRNSFPINYHNQIEFFLTIQTPYNNCFCTKCLKHDCL